MVQEFAQLYSDLISSKEYKTFQEKNDDYYLAHGFIQLDANHQPKEPWQIGFYSPKKDNLAVFNTDPIKHNGFEEAFKKEQTIDKLDFDSQTCITTQKAMDIVKTIMQEEYDQQTPMSYLCILQSINATAVFNITVITQSFAMIPIRIDAHSGEVLSHEQRSVLDLKKEEIKGELQ